MADIYPAILSGGSGTRLWPLSRRAYPKQFLKLVGDESLLQATCRRLADPLFEQPTIIGNQEHRFLIGEQLGEIGVEARRIILEPVARNTAPAAAVAALLAAADDEQALVLLLPSDHVVPDSDAFVRCLRAGMEAAREGALVTFGVAPDSPHTGYGYLEVAEETGDVRPVARFVEKPDREAAEHYVESGRFFWNAGIFLFAARSLLSQFETHAPETLHACRRAVEGARKDLDFLRLDEAAYAEAQNISLDYAIMEKADTVRCVPLETRWSDVGSWSGIWEIMDKDGAGNVTHGQGEVILHEAANCFAYSDHACVSLVGLDNVLVVVTKDAVLVAAQDHAESVARVVDHLKANGRNEVVWHNRVYRPWGWYEGLSEGDRFQVKCLMVKPGAQLSLQSHHHRAEHWVVVKGTASVTVGEETRLVAENESTYIPLGEKHRLANPGKIPALLIEVQSGAYIGEDDIVRFDDAYGRPPAD